MKKSIAIVLLAIVAQAHGQSFEGTITWAAKPAPVGTTASLTMKVKGTTIITMVNGGMMNGIEMWFMDNYRKAARVMRPQKMFVVVPPEAMAACDKAVTMGKFKKTSETAKVLTYTCTKYTGEIRAKGVTIKVNYWTTTEVSDELKMLAHNPDPFESRRLPEGVEGVPLKIERMLPAATTALEVTEVKREKLKAEDFIIPADFKEMGNGS
jgi:hypothetical protein